VYEITLGYTTTYCLYEELQ